MGNPRRQLVLNAFFQRFGHHPTAWRHPSQKDDGVPRLSWWVQAARMAEEAKFDAFFLADFVGRAPDQLEEASRNGQNYQFEPLTLMSAIAASTRHVGLVVTVNTNFSEPYAVARALSSLDHISGGRVGWNVVSSLSDAASKSFGLPHTRGHGERYERAAEFVEVAKALWDSWDDDAFQRPNRESGRFFEPASAHPVRHRGEHFAIEAVLDVPRPIQGHPVFVQAGNSDTGRDFAASIAEMTYCSAQSLSVAQEYYADVKRRAAQRGRDPDHVKITPGLSVVVAESDGAAQDRFDDLQNAIDFRHGVRVAGVDLSGYPLDGPLPDLPESENGKGRFRQMVELARRENLTIRQLVLRFSVSRGHLQVIGSPKTVADRIEEWFVERGADGFNVVPPLLPSGFVDFARLVVPELQRRGLFRREYTGSTLREHLGLPRPATRRAR
ncbi:LLM class flavin-dependent oxidoreductase [Sandaracinus amylolyticus]|uniref:LLM class flavin-dependent oxidoreductase n=1 Tax=Sandaracinus amylolyticus TaxID=927083 RepID=UPI001F36C5E6|nr:LLM class flavin-dependent oxidoreductase [Sandaracinus amylolyticus]UJR83977.1 Hypothetical protein I5071_60480 [Sandaracinus amylolyticus]